MRRPRPYILALLAAVLLTLPFAIGAGDAVLDAKRSAAAKLLKDGKAADAQKLYEEIVAQDDSAWSDHYALAKIYDKAGETAKAVAAYQQVVKSLRGSAKIPAERTAMGESEKRLKVLDEVSQKLDAAVALFAKQLRDLAKEAEKSKNLAALKRIDTLLAGLAVRTMVKVSAKAEWQDTGIDVVQGQEYRLTTSGTWTMSVRVPNGATSAKGSDGAAAMFRGLPYGMLIAKIDDSPVIPIGEERTLKAPASGRLMLRANDDQVSDNSGEIDVGIEMR